MLVVHPVKATNARPPGKPASPIRPAQTMARHRHHRLRLPGTDPTHPIAHPWHSATMHVTLTAHHWHLVLHGRWWHCRDASNRLLGWGAYPHTALRRALGGEIRYPPPQRGR
jgi:hypothetical protein